MKSLHTEVKIAPSTDKLSVGDKVLTLGSCFSDVIGQKLKDYKFNTLVNPMGVVFNPISIAKLLIQNEEGLNRVVERNGMFCHYDYHFDIRSESKEVLKALITAKHTEVASFVENTDWLIITLGTAFVYELKSNKTIVSNCHKIPQNQFDKRMLSLQEMLDSFEKLLSHVKNLNPTIKVILTVSPVRHLKDGLADNQMSKSLLRVLCGLLSERGNVDYFPSYEMMIDELRDYRYYKEDMLHPTRQAEEMLWERFSSTYFDEHTKAFQKEWKSILSAIQHRPFNPKSESHQKFIRQQLEKLSKLDDKIDISGEVKFLESQLV